MTDQTAEEKDAGSEEAQVEQTEQADKPEGESLKDKVEDVVDSVKDKFTGGDKADEADKADDSDKADDKE